MGSEARQPRLRPYYRSPEKDFGVGRQSFADERKTSANIIFLKAIDPEPAQEQPPRRAVPLPGQRLAPVVETHVDPPPPRSPCSAAIRQRPPYNRHRPARNHPHCRQPAATPRGSGSRTPPRSPTLARCARQAATSRCPPTSACTSSSTRPRETPHPVTLKTAFGTGIAVAPGMSAILRCDGAKVVRVTPDS